VQQIRQRLAIGDIGRRGQHRVDQFGPGVASDCYSIKAPDARSDCLARTK
jgi:hypothetical protein